MNKKWSYTRGLIFALPLSALAFCGASQAAGVVGGGTAVSCTEAALDTALTGGGAVSFNCGAAPVTITVTARKNITVLTTIDGGNLVTLSGGNAVSLFNVTGGGLSVQNIALVNGQDTVGNPGAAAILASVGPINITDTTISGHHTNFGGCPAVSVSGAFALNITRSTISGNVNAAPATGSAVCAGGTVVSTIANSTFANNTGGAFFTSGTATFTNSTIAGNTATGVGNSGGLSATGGAVTFRNSILANNVATGPAIGQCFAVAGGTMTNGGGNLQYPNAFCSGTTPLGDPLLGPLANNGGPTQTMALGLGSPAIDQANPANCPAADQRGVARTDGDGNGSVVCDVGAFEAATLVITPQTPAAIPTLGEAGLALMMLLLAGFGAFAVKRRHDAH